VLGDRRVTAVDDLAAPAGAALPPTDGVRFWLDGGRVIVRPSGTEPKLKAYVEAVTEPALGLERGRAAAAERLAAIVADLGPLLEGQA
jgi:phosphomannomutase